MHAPRHDDSPLHFGGKEALFAFALSVAVALVCHILYSQIAAWEFAKLGKWHSDHMRGGAPAPLQYRWFSFIVPELLASLGVPLKAAYLGLRFLYLAGAMWFIARVARETVKSPLAPAFMILAAGLYYAASTQPFLQPAEEPNLLVFGLFAWLVLRGADVRWLVPVLAIGALNKDTVGFLLPWLFLYRWHVQKLPRLAIRDTLILGATFFLIYGFLRVSVGTQREYLGGFWQVGENLRYIAYDPARGLMWTLPSVLPLAFVLRHWDRTPLWARCFVPSLVLFVLGHWLISRVEEFRTYTPLAIFMWTAVLAMVTGEKRVQPAAP